MPLCPLKCYWRFQAGVRNFGYTLHVTFFANGLRIWRMGTNTFFESSPWHLQEHGNQLVCRSDFKTYYANSRTFCRIYSGPSSSFYFTTSFFAGKLGRITSPRSASLLRKMSESMWKNCWRPWLQPPAWKSVNGPCKLLPLGSKLHWVTPRKFMLLWMAEDVRQILCASFVGQLSRPGWQRGLWRFVRDWNLL